MMALEAAKAPPIFKLTPRMLEVSAGYCVRRVVDDASLATLVHSTYCLIYEAAGGDKLRFLGQQGGPLSDAEAGFIWKFKHLRNKWLAHDPGHGDSSGNYRALLGAFEFFGLNSMPSEQGDFEVLHRGILMEARAFLRILVKKLSGAP